MLVSMTADDQQADNIFSRLISYTPRTAETGHKRTPLEDFCTEALAWCLRNSEPFRQDFLAMIDAKAAGAPPSLGNGGAPVEVQTQLSFNVLEEENSENEELSAGKRRFDLVIRSSRSEEFAIVVENKFRWVFTEQQISVYHHELHTGRQFAGFRTKRLVLLSRSGRKVKEHPDVIPLKWSDVQKKLGQASGSDPAQKMGRPFSSHPLSVCAQFADFLASKGLVSMTIPRTNDESIRNCVEGMKLRTSLETILVEARNEYAKHKLSRNISFDCDDNGESWLGLYNKDTDFLYIGFKLTARNGVPDFRMLVQVKAPPANSPLAAQLQQLDGQWLQEGADRYVCLEKEIPGSEFAGDAEKIRDWFDERLEVILRS
jgi:hypothetical protein